MSINMKNINLNNIIKIAKKTISPIWFFKRTKLMQTKSQQDKDQFGKHWSYVSPNSLWEATVRDICSYNS